MANLPSSYSEMYPGRFVKADMFRGKAATFTILNIEGEELIGENNKKKPEWIVSFTERKCQWVMNKTNAFCLSRMFGSDPHAWIGKRITLFPTTTEFGRKTVDCIRVWGSPDIAEDMEITVPQGRKRAWETVMHKVESKRAASAPKPAPAPAEPAHKAEVNARNMAKQLGWNDTELAQELVAAGGDWEILEHSLNSLSKSSENEF